MPGGLSEAGIRAVVEGYDNYIRQTQGMDKATSGMASGMQTASGKASGLGKSVGSTAAGFITAQVAMSAMSGGFKFLIGNAAAFEKGLDAVGAVSGATEKQMGGLADTAKRIGADTAFSASQAVTAMESLAANGLSVTDIMDGAADATASLAAAGGTDLVLAADTVSTAMSVWKLNTDQMGDAVNRLAGAANVSRFGVEDMAQAVATGGGAAAAAGVEFGDFTTTIAGIAPYFTSGSDAGTSFKTMLTSMTPKSKEAEKAMRELGIITADGSNQFFDAAGNMKSMAEVAGVLNKATSGLSEQQKLAALSTIFGTDAMRAAIGVSELTADAFAELDQKMAGTDAAVVAAQRMDNLSGDMEALTGSIETAGIALGQRLIPAMADAVGVATDLVNGFGALPESTQNTALGFLAIAAAMPIVVSAGGRIVSVFASIATGSAGAGTKLTLMGLGLAAVATAADLILQKTTGAGLFDHIFGDVSKIEAAAKAVDELNAALTFGKTPADKVQISMRLLADSTRDLGTAGGEAALGQSGLQNALLGSDNRIFGFNVGLSDGVDKLNLYRAEVEKAGEALATNALASGSATTATNLLFDAHEKLPPALQEAFEKGSNYNEMLGELVKAQGFAATSLLDSAVAIDAEALAAGAAAGEVLKLGDQTKGAVSANGKWLDSLRDAEGKLGDVGKAIQDLMGIFADANPAYINLTAQNAILGIEIAKLKAKGDDLNTTEQAHLKALEAQVEANDKVKASMAGNQKAVEDMSGVVMLLIGTTGYGALSKAMIDANRPLESQRDLVAKLASVYNDLAAGRLPEAIAKVNELKDATAPEEWAPIAEGLVNFAQQLGGDVGPAFVAGINGLQTTAGTAIESLMGEAFMLAGPGVSASAFSMGSESGTALAKGIQAGIAIASYGIALEAVKAVEDAITAANTAAQNRSPSHRTEREIGIPMAQGIAVGIAKGASEVTAAMVALVMAGMEAGAEAVTEGEEIVQTAYDAFIATLAAHAQSDAIMAQFGNAGGKIVEALEAALAADGPAMASAGIALANSIDSLINAAEEAGVPNATALGDALMAALATAISERTPEAVAAALAAIGQINDAITQAGLLTMDSLFAALGTSSNDSGLADRIGTLGVGVMKALEKGLTEGGKGAVAAMAKSVNDVKAQLAKGLPPDQADYLGALFMDALRESIETGSAESAQALEDVLGLIHTVLDKGAVDIRNGVVVTGAEIKKLADLTGLTAEQIRGNIAQFIDSGILPMIAAVKKVSPEMADFMQGAIDAFENGSATIEQIIEVIIGLIRNMTGAINTGQTAINGMHPPAGGGGGAPGANAPSGGGPTGSTPGAPPPVWNPAYGSHPPNGTVWLVGGQPMMWTNGYWRPHGWGGPAYAEGTPFVPHDQLAQVHQGEAIIPADQNPFTNTVGATGLDLTNAVLSADEVILSVAGGAGAIDFGLEHIAQQVDSIVTPIIRYISQREFDPNYRTGGDVPGAGPHTSLGGGGQGLGSWGQNGLGDGNPVWFQRFRDMGGNPGTLTPEQLSQLRGEDARDFLRGTRPLMEFFGDTGMAAAQAMLDAQVAAMNYGWGAPAGGPGGMHGSGGYWGPPDPFYGPQSGPTWIPGTGGINPPPGFDDNGNPLPVSVPGITVDGGNTSDAEAYIPGSFVPMPSYARPGSGGTTIIFQTPIDFSGANFLESATTIEELVETAVGNVIDDQLGRAADLLGHSYSGPMT